MAPPCFARLTCGGRPIGARALGLILIFVTAVIWVAASFLSSALVSSRPGASPLHAPPLLLTYLATSVFTLFLPLVHARRLVVRLLQQRWVGIQLPVCWRAYSQHATVVEQLNAAEQKNASYGMQRLLLCASCWHAVAPTIRPSHNPVCA